MAKYDDSKNSNEKAIKDLLSINLKTIEHDEAIELLEHLKNQFQNRYRYLVGEWSNAHRAKSTITGVFASNQEVIDYLNQ
jgi:hypothetical protein